MADIISAKCAACGYVIRVPVTLAGKNARCPGCTRTMVIPAPSRNKDDVVPDTELPEVARDDEILEGLPIEEGEAEYDPEPPTEQSSGVQRRAAHSASAARRANVGGGGSRSAMPRYVPPARKKKSNAGVIVGVVVALAVVAIVAAVAAGGKGGAKKTGPEAPAAQPKEPPPPEIDSALASRCYEFIEAVQRGDPKQVLKFYAFEPDQEALMLRQVNQFLDQKITYDTPEVKVARADTGAVVFSYGGGREKSFTWTQVDGAWRIADKPGP